MDSQGQPVTESLQHECKRPKSINRTTEFRGHSTQQGAKEKFTKNINSIFTEIREDIIHIKED